MITQWTLAKLEAVKDEPRVLLRDPLRLLPRSDPALDRFAEENGFRAVETATNLAFRALYEGVMADPTTRKVLVIDRAPLRRRTARSTAKAPPPFYPDFLAQTAEHARIDLDLRQFLRETTHDPGWPAEVNEPRYAALIVRHLPAVVQAHQALRLADRDRFTDADLKRVVAFAALGLPDAAFKRPAAQDYWQMGLLGHDALDALDSLMPEVTRPIKEQLRQAPAPFCWLADHNPALVVRAFYLAAILAQHTDQWSLLLANLDPALQPFARMEAGVVREAAPQLVALEPEHADADLGDAEASLGRDALRHLVDHLKLHLIDHAADVLERERYSTLLRALALLHALDNLVAARPNREAHARIHAALFGDQPSRAGAPVERRPSPAVSGLKLAYSRAYDLLGLRGELDATLKALSVTATEDLTAGFFRSAWNDRRLNRLEYYLSDLERILDSADLLPRPADDLPPTVTRALDTVRRRVQAIHDEVHADLDRLNHRFQDLVAARYAAWTRGSEEVVLTAQFIERCLKAHWDPETEPAALFIFDGMRYDIWDELLRPTLMSRMQPVAELPGLSLVPSETRFTRKAISAGVFPDQFDAGVGEDRLLQEALKRAFRQSARVEALTPESAGTGETVRLRAGNLDVYIFELCDSSLHNIPMRARPDGSLTPSRPLAWVYNQLVKNVLDNEVSAIVRGLKPGTKVFITADHGFARVGREQLWLDEKWLNAPEDCKYVNARLPRPVSNLMLPPKVADNSLELPMSTLRMPTTEDSFDPRQRATREKRFASLIFPRPGYAFKRPRAGFKPDAYTHGGISVQELTIPMVVLQVRPRDSASVGVDLHCAEPSILQGQAVEVRLNLRWTAAAAGDIRVDVAASYVAGDGKRRPDQGGGDAGSDLERLPDQVAYIGAAGTEVVLRFAPRLEVSAEERRQGRVDRTLSIVVSYREGYRPAQVVRTQRFTVKLDDPAFQRVPNTLGRVLGAPRQKG